MATVQISDLYEATPFDRYIQLNSLRKNRFIESGLAINSRDIAGLMAQGGRLFEMPNLNPLAAAEPNYSTDTAGTSTPKNIDAGVCTAVRHSVNDSWSVMDLARTVAGTTGGDPMAVIADQVLKYWDTDISRRLSASLQGIILDNIANDGGDMVNDIASEDGNNATASNLWSASALIDAEATMGDSVHELGAMIVHSVVYNNMRKQQLIDFIPDSEGRTNIPIYQGMRVFTDDYVPKVAGSTSGYKYYTFVFGPGIVAIGNEDAPIPSELDRNPNAGNGAGESILHSRRELVVHPYGFNWELAAGTNPTYANLALATSWDRKYDRQQIKMACLISNG